MRKSIFKQIMIAMGRIPAPDRFVFIIALRGFCRGEEFAQVAWEGKTLGSDIQHISSTSIGTVRFTIVFNKIVQQLFDCAFYSACFFIF